MSSSGYYNSYGHPFAEAPAPPPMGPSGGYYGGMPPPEVDYAEPGSPLVFPVSPIPSPIPSRDSSRNRRGTIGGGEPYIHVPDDRGRERLYHTGGRLAVGDKHLGRSNSERSRTRPKYMIEVASSSRGRGGRSPSIGANYYYEGHKKVYREGSAYSGSSYGGSREHSRSHSRVRGRHSRSPSCDSCDGYDDQRVGFPRNYEDDISEQLRKVQMQLQQVNNENDKKRKEDEAQRLEKLRTAEIERKVAEQLEMQRKKESERAAAESRRAEEEKRRISEAARKLLEEQEAKKQAEARQKREEEQKIKDGVARALEERNRMMGLEPAKQQQQQQRRTYTKFSKVHLCREALEERNIAFTEEPEHFLVHRAVDKTEQNYLWGRTKEIRSYYRQIQEAADKAQTVRGPDGGYVKYVQIAGQPYPIALPVTITRTPGGGQTSSVDPIKIKWTDIFSRKY